MSSPSRPEPPAESPSQSRRSLRPSAVILLVVGVLLAGAVVAVGTSTKPRAVDGTLTKSLGGEASACTSTSIALTPVEGVDLAEQGPKLLDAFDGMEGVGMVTLHTDDPRVEVQFCDSTTSEQALRGALAGTGLVTF